MSAADFERATGNAWFVATSPQRDPKRAQDIMTQALEWARAHSEEVSRSRIALALQEDADIAQAARSYDRAEASAREALANLDAVTPPDEAKLYQVLRRIVGLSLFNGHPAIELAKRFSILSGSVLETDLMLAMGAPDVQSGSPDGFARQAQDPLDVALRPVRSSLDSIITTLLDAPGAKTELAAAIITRQAVVQDVEAGIQAALLQQDSHPPVAPDPLAAYFRNFPREPSAGPLPPLDRLRANAAAMSMLAYADPNIVPQRLPRPLQLQHERTDVQREIANTLRNDWKTVPVQEVLKAIPANAIVLEYVSYERPATARQEHGEARYLVAALSASGVIRVADIGSFAEINALAGTACRALLQDREGVAPCVAGKPDVQPLPTIQAVGRQLFEALLGPVAPAVAGAEHLIVIADGALQFLPFEALTDRDGRYLIRSHLVSYLQSPREIALWKEPAISSHAPATIIADPDYDAGGAAKPDDCSDSDRGAARRLRAGSLNDFPRLCGATAEATRIREVLPDATLLTRKEATEEAIKELFGPRILHIATHGFVVNQLEWPDSWHHVEEYGIWWNQLDFQVMDRDAMLRSGLVLAGANVRRSPGGRDDGILSAREASLLDLQGTQLVVLSACDSGLGVARAGDGVMGLRRAFVLAGARAETFALWPIGDFTTASFMGRYYALLSQGSGNMAALAQVKREFIDRGGIWAEPWIWAAFVGYGYPGALGK